MVRNEKGEGKGGLIVGLLLLIAVVYTGWKVIPVMIQVYSFEDEVREDCKYLHGRKIETLVKDLSLIAQRENIPVDESDIQAERYAGSLRVEIKYTIPIEFPGYTYNWDQDIKYDAPVFE